MGSGLLLRREVRGWGWDAVEWVRGELGYRGGYEGVLDLDLLGGR